MNIKQYLHLAGIAISVMISSTAQAELILSSPPILDKEKSERIFVPFAEALSDILDEPVSYAYPDDWMSYSREMRLGNYDLLFDQAHFVSWRLQPQNIFHRALVSLPKYEKYVVVSKSDTRYAKLDDLLNQRVCSLPSPGLSTIVFLSQFSNPVRQPVMVEAQGSFSNVMQKFNSGSCVAAVVSEKFYLEHSNEFKAQQTQLIFTSKQIPSHTLTITKKQPTQKAEMLVNALTDELSPKGSERLFSEFGIQQEKFQTADLGELDKLKFMLQGVVWGW